jgi:hypothetical protein
MKKITQFFIKRNDHNKEIDTEKGNYGGSEKGVSDSESEKVVNDLDIVNETDLLNKTVLSNINTSITDDDSIPNHGKLKNILISQINQSLIFLKMSRRESFKKNGTRNSLGLNTMFSLTQLFVLFVNNSR